jgi:hypothetical protein
MGAVPPFNFYIMEFLMRKKYNGHSYPVYAKKKYTHGLVQFISRKTKDYGLSAVLPGIGYPPETKLALCLPEDNPNGEPFWALVPVSQLYVKKHRQDKLSHELDPIDDFRNVHVDLWNQMCRNYETLGVFQPNWILRDETKDVTVEQFYE